MSGGIQQDVNIFSDMLFMDTLRGMDATGIGMYSRDGDMRMMKAAGPAYEVMGHKAYGLLMKDFIKDGKALIGHNRKATVGKIADETSHPFLIPEYKDGGFVKETGYMFMHNGSLRNWEKLVDGITTEVDSEMLGHLLASCNGDKVKIEEALSKVHGAYACIWFDQTQDNMYIVRNSERPLIMAETAFGLLVSSEIGILAAAAGRNNAKIDKWLPVEPDTLYTVPIDKHSKAEVTEEKLTIKKYMPPTTTRGRVAKTTAAKQSKFAAELEEGDVSKNSFKRIRAAYVGCTLGFWLDDYQHRVLGDPDCKKWIVFGSNIDDYTFNHKFQGLYDGATEAELVDDFAEMPFYGVVDEVVYNKDEKSVTFLMKTVKVIEKSRLASIALH